MTNDQVPLSRLDRRRFLGLAGAATFSVAFSGPFSVGRARAARPLGGYPFTLGVASGDPRPRAVVLWTRLAPDPLNGGGMPEEPIPVRWLVARNERLTRVVRRGVALARPESAHSVHVDVHGLAPGHDYFYAFEVAGERSAVARTRTAPARSSVEELRFAFASCQNYTAGLYPAYANLAREDLDLVVHLGDYIYEGAGSATDFRQNALHQEVMTLEEYRNRHAQYKTDPDLQAAHAAFPWILSWDDHEVENNYADEISEPPTDPEAFLLRRAAAYQAYWEHLPLRRFSRPVGPDLRLYRRLSFGELVEFNVLDTRQYRSDQPGRCAESEKLPSGYCPRAVDPAQMMLGGEQKDWLFEGLDGSPALWNVLAQQVRFAQADGDPDPARRDFGGGDNWNGYVAERQEILDFIGERRPANPVVLTGDIHTNWVYDLNADFDDASSETLATEFIGTAISSGGDPASRTVRIGGTPDNPHERFFNNNKGYVRCTVDQERWQTDFRVVPTVRDREAVAETLATFVVEEGRAGAELA